MLSVIDLPQEKHTFETRMESFPTPRNTGFLIDSIAFQEVDVDRRNNPTT